MTDLRMTFASPDESADAQREPKTAKEKLLYFSKVDRSVGAFFRNHVVSILGLIALGAVLNSWVLDIAFDLVPIGHLPVLYDLCLAYLTGWFFHILVVVIPERRRLRHLIQTLQGSLMLVANNGHDLIRDLEFIGKCPERNINDAHINLVLRTIGNGGTKFVAERLSVARDAFLRLEPYLTLLPIELTAALQRVDQVFLHDQLDVPRKLTYDKSHTAMQPEDIRNSGSMWPKVDGKYVPKRYTLVGWAEPIKEYYRRTEAVRAAIPAKYLSKKNTESEHVVFWHMHKMNSDYPYTEYPPTAFSDDWVGEPPQRPAYLRDDQ
ncbi:hypothetical protein HRK28_17135 [Rathayibacter sp. VKM Ac-2835]|uniref:hypothetical protein n=1 Tax=Rathayibacter sp. VKM Ac-2835 TaxID=2739043 RepID=UPI001565CE61|nr:hypothetical protein [Rathayibacter sp. VKM Ac-2835]NRG42640.1 hypothetical protein [Rathayibacter sp. VKM Ac-2835]